MTARWKGAEAAPIVGGRCSKHGKPVAPLTKVCIDCHHEALDAAGFDWRSIGSMRLLAEGASGWRARHEEAAS